MTSPAMTPYFSAPVLPVATSVPQSNVSLLAPVAHPKAETQPTFVGLGAPLPFAPTPMDTKCLPLNRAMSAADISSLQATARENLGHLGQQTSGVLAAPTVIIKQPEPVRPYTGATSYRAYKEYFLRICDCNRWNNSTERARHLLVAMDGPAAEAVRGLKAEKDSDLNQIWGALHRRFGFVDEPERAMRRFDVRKQQDGESLAVFEQNLRILHREAWPKTDLKSPEADSLLRRMFVDG